MSKSTDGGGTWAATGLTTVYSVITLVIDPTAHNTIYAGTNGGEVFKSRDGGDTWSASRTNLTGASVNAFAIDPINSAILYAGTSNFAGIGSGVFKSTDSGSTWGAVNTGLPYSAISSIDSLAIDPIMPDTLYAAASYGGVFKSTDGGDTWSDFNSGLNSLSVASVAIDPAKPGTVYAALYDELQVLSIEQPAACVGDCSHDDTVTVDEILTLVNIALGNADPSTCPHGVASGADINVATILQAVSNALSGCPLT